MSTETNKPLSRTRKSAGEKKRDPNLDNEAVRKYRDVIHLQLNYIQRAEVAYAVEDSPRGLRVWEATLLEFMLRGRNPKDVLEMLKVYRAMMPNGNGHR